MPKRRLGQCRQPNHVDGKMPSGIDGHHAPNENVSRRFRMRLVISVSDPRHRRRNVPDTWAARSVFREVSMPWKACSAMDERVRSIRRLQDGEGMSEVCRAFGISRKNGYEICDRYRREGLWRHQPRRASPSNASSKVNSPTCPPARENAPEAAVRDHGCLKRK